MEKYELQKLRDLPIEGVAERLGLSVRMHKALCPFHDDHHASLSFSVRRNSFRCFVCGAHGGPIDLVMRHLHVDFKKACRWLADEHNVIIDEWQPRSTSFNVHRSTFLATPHSQRENVQCSTFNVHRYTRYFEHPFLNDEARHFLFDERRLDPRVVRWCRLTSWRDKQQVPWLQIPYYDREGKLVGIQNRNLGLTLQGKVGGGAPRFRFPQGSECGIYNLPVLNMLRAGEPLYITEGCSDCWAMLSAGHKAIAIPSATLLKRKDAEQLSTFHFQHSTPFIMYPDRDEPGERLFMQLKELLPNLEHRQLPPDCKDFGEYYLRQNTG